ncbi:MAG: TolC family protein [Deltaproteobacteria bacterium]|nr:TolC family protein [Deltaproteobacteria bacterium]
MPQALAPRLAPSATRRSSDRHPSSGGAELPAWRGPALANAAVALIVLLVAAPATAQTMTPERALRQAATRNPTLRAAILDTSAARAAVRAAQNARRPSLVAGVDAQLAEGFSATSAGVARNVDRRASGSVGLRYTTDWGTSVQIDAGTGLVLRDVLIDPSSTDTASIRPTFSSDLSVSARQPLLRGAGSDVVLAEIEEARASRTQSEHQRDQAASELALDVLTAYWELWYAEQALAVQVASEQLTRRQLSEARLRAEQLGTTAQIDTLRFESELASIRESLEGARSDRDTRATELGRLLAMDPATSDALRAAAAAPTPHALPPLAELLRSARTSSSELRALEAQIAATRIRLRSAEDARQLRLDLTGSLTAAGLWTDDSLPGLQLPDNRPAFGVMIGLELELPLGESRETANAIRARTQLEASLERYEARVDALESQVATLRRRIQAATRRVELATESVSLSQRLAEGERQRLSLGTGTPWEVVQAQQAARQSELRRLRVVVDLVNSEHQLDHVTGRLLGRVAFPSSSEESS